MHQAQWLSILIRHCQLSSGVFRLDISQPPLIYLTPEHNDTAKALADRYLQATFPPNTRYDVDKL
ncbi:hypothetical protein, partial [uncultured Stenotrophomonas sp.]|uniref:hypothetical protein n=1 Tax=uncultured Stenotrophomonas sp. TaxID=165438 RepID=UPI00260119FD